VFPVRYGLGFYILFRRISSNHNLKISTEKTRIMAFKRKQATGSKFILENRMIELVNKFDFGGIL
jgi:hypothetical protein